MRANITRNNARDLMAPRLLREWSMATRLQTLPGWFSDEEEEFFRAGTVTDQAEPVDTFADLDVGYERPGLLQRFFGRRAPKR
jgi:hypothetical protein